MEAEEDKTTHHRALRPRAEEAGGLPEGQREEVDRRGGGRDAFYKRETGEKEVGQDWRLYCCHPDLMLQVPGFR